MGTELERRPEVGNGVDFLAERAKLDGALIVEFRGGSLADLLRQLGDCCIHIVVRSQREAQEEEDEKAAHGAELMEGFARLFPYEKSRMKGEVATLHVLSLLHI